MSNIIIEEGKTPEELVLETPAPVVETPKEEPKVEVPDM
jgi:hypothetical protein